MNSPLRIVFAGTPEFAASSLAALLEQSHQIIAVYTQPDRPAGRGRKLVQSPVKQLALQHNLPVYQPLNFKSDQAIDELAALHPDLMIVAAYGLLLPQAVLNLPRLGCINVHASLLPRWRGAAPIHRALLAGDSQTGITIMQMDAGLDTGAMLYKRSTNILPGETAGSLHDRLAALGAETLIDSLVALIQGQLKPEKQDDSQACYAAKLVKEEGRIDWSLPAEQLAVQIRGLNPWPVAFCRLEDETLRIWQAEADASEKTTTSPGTLTAIQRDGLVVATGQGLLKLTHIQLPGKRAQPVSALLNGQHPFTVGMRFS
ncbi:methionyl-tRNA formyltransferase [Nitrincola iocasae]|jgi:methionyl-tRNA formyltransferase|uniref:Methionyl-tRNA formyltransferase n=1 Tax=Nitrincola iocasae TaxID=2614693 RepID=A0A5J6L8Q7_9GAMM|nr:methionyl-tRNA formyltransferase [Nitrincola iocasae]QEW05019.1 methionyl-tRNA formyltransferase [Nitrincola iocasae]